MASGNIIYNFNNSWSEVRPNRIKFKNKKSCSETLLKNKILQIIKLVNVDELWN